MKRAKVHEMVNVNIKLRGQIYDKRSQSDVRVN